MVSYLLLASCFVVIDIRNLFLFFVCFFGSDALQCIMLPFATPISFVRLSMTSRSTAKMVRDRPMITMGSL